MNSINNSTFMVLILQGQYQMSSLEPYSALRNRPKPSSELLSPPEPL